MVSVTVAVVVLVTVAGARAEAAAAAFGIAVGAALGASVGAALALSVDMSLGLLSLSLWEPWSFRFCLGVLADVERGMLEMLDFSVEIVRSFMSVPVETNGGGGVGSVALGVCSVSYEYGLQLGR